MTTKQCETCQTSKNVRVFANMKFYCSKECFSKRPNLGIRFSRGGSNR